MDATGDNDDVSDASPKRFSWKLHAVAAFVLFHVLANCSDAIPDASMGLKRSYWSEPRARTELQRWADTLGVTRTTLEDALWTFGTTYQKARNVITEPTHWWMRVVGNRQVWSMFVAGARIREIFVVRGIHDDGTQEVLYRRADPQHRWHAAVLEHPRLRSASNRWSWKQQRRAWTDACDSIARTALAERPEFKRVECLFEKGDSPSPKDAAAGIHHPVKDDLVVGVSRASMNVGKP